MKKILFTAFLSFLLVLIFSTFSSSEVEAQVSIDYPKYEVEVDINSDSSFQVRETITSRITGTFHGLRRDIPLENFDCDLDRIGVCGGFESIVPLGLYDENGNIPDRGTIRFYFVEDALGNEFARFEWELHPDGKDVENEIQEWTIEYKIYGGMGRIEGNPAFYWDLIPNQGWTSIEEVEITINAPPGARLSESDFRLDTQFRNDSRVSTRAVEITAEKLTAGSNMNITSILFFDENEIALPRTGEFSPGIVEYDITNLDDIEINLLSVQLNSFELSNTKSGVIQFLPKGDYQLLFERLGYEPQKFEFEIASADDTTVIELNLEPEPWMTLLRGFSNLQLILGIVLVPIIAYLPLRIYTKKGKDAFKKTTVVPIFSPPENISPYLLGSLKDERVNKEDITGSIIDLAYRGYIKIKEIKKNKNYELTKLNKPKQKEDKLNDREQELIDALFPGEKVKLETKNIGKSFIKKVKELEKNIYNEMVEKEFFDKNPRSTRNKYLGLGIAILILGAISTVGLTVALLTIIGLLTVFTTGIGIAFAGLILIFISQYMPAKTEKGAELFRQIKGFKMYMETAERYRVQNLDPKDFERYLSYAVVFKIEKKWAEKFKDIYKGSPDWIEGTNTAWDVFWISQFSRGFANSTSHSITAATRTSGGGGGGWSGGGSFGGGFSGGGGGGGSVGGW